MKSWIVNVSILLAVCSSCFLYTRKFAVPGKQDMLIASLAGIHRYLSPGTTIKLINMVPANPEKIRIEIFPYFIAFIVPPARISRAEIKNRDTILVLLPASAPQKIRDSLLNNETVIWQNKDSLYQYLLIH